MAHVDKVDFDIDNTSSSGQVPYSISVEYYVDTDAYNELAYTLDMYLVQAGATRTRNVINSSLGLPISFNKSTIYLAHADNGTWVLDQYDVSANIFNDINVDFAQLIQKSLKNSVWQVSVTDKAGKSYVKEPASLRIRQYTNEKWTERNLKTVSLFGLATAQDIPTLRNADGTWTYEKGADRRQDGILVTPAVAAEGSIMLANYSALEKLIVDNDYKNREKLHPQATKIIFSGTIDLSELENISSMGVVRIR
ncbi:MAG: hypothetical protein LBV04_05045 [Deferribacteraceae bacterium]|nr:hypothetical protein [Deferribacteraceae bacterium]